MYTKKLFIIFVLIAGVLLTPLRSYADANFQTSSYPPSFCSPTYNDLANCSYAFTDQDNQFSTYFYGGSGSPKWAAYNIPNIVISQNAIIDSVVYKVRGYATGSAFFKAFYLGLYKEGNPNYFGYISANCSNAQTIVPSGSNTLYTQEVPASCYYQHTITPQDINDPNFGIVVWTGANGQANFYIDSVSVSIKYHYSTIGYTLNIDSSSASPSGGYISMNLSGSTASISGLMHCEAALLQNCTKPDYASINSQSAVAHIELDPSYTDSTTKELYYSGSTYYQAHGWVPPNTTWKAENVHVPYNPGFTCSYPVTYTCTANHELVDQVNLTAQQASTQPNQDVNAPPITDPFQWLAWKFNQILISVFGIDQQANQQYLYALNNALSTKVPTAYILSLSVAGFGTPIGSPSAIPDFNLSWSPKWVHGNNTTNIAPVDIHIPGNKFNPVQPFLTFMRTFFDVTLWVSFLFWILFNARKLLS
jgi:hypothetical protein